MRAFFLVVVLLSAGQLLSGCGVIVGGIAAIAGGSGGGSGSGNSQAVLALESDRLDLKTSPAKLRFTLTDLEENPIDISLSFRVGGQAPVPMALVGADQNLLALESSAGGTRYERLWDFAAAGQLGSEATTRDVTLVLGGTEGGRDLETTALRDVGNDPPRIEGLSGAEEVVGTANLTFLTLDDDTAPRDSLSLRADFKLRKEPDDAFRPASGDVVIAKDGRPIGFFWKVVDDLGFTERDIVFRVTASDGFAEGAPAAVEFRVDNNRAPLVVLDTSSFVQNSDDRRGIPIPFTVFDGDSGTGEPGDEIRVVFQWRRNRELEFPPLPLESREDLVAILTDSEERRRRQICAERPLSFLGRLLESTASSTRLPELATSGAPLLETDPETGQPRLRGTLEILRSSSVPRSVASSSGKPLALEHPVSALPLPGGETSLVLESLSDRGWRLRTLHLATGEIVSGPGEKPLAEGEGTPTAMTYEREFDSVLISVSLDEFGTWQIRRVSISGNGVNEVLITSDGSFEGGPVRGLTALSPLSFVLTVGSSLIRVDRRDGGRIESYAIFGPPTPVGLETPWGVVKDPLYPDRIYVAERDRNRILQIDLEKRIRSEIIANPEGEESAALPLPSSIALENGGTRLLVITDRDRGDGHAELRALDLGESTDTEEDGFADARVFLIASPIAEQDGYRGPVGQISTGEDGVRLIALPEENDLAVGGGVEQRRRLSSAPSGYDPKEQRVTVLEPFDPIPGDGQPWRIRKSSVEVVGQPSGTTASFVWETDEVAREDFVVLRAIPLDREIGIADETSSSKQVRGPVDFKTLKLQGSAPSLDGPTAIAAADLDGDGDLDLATANEVGNNLKLFFQTSPGLFSAKGPVGRDHCLGDFASTPRPQSVLACDLDDDGRTDLLSTNVGNGTATIFFQTETPGTFEAVPFVLPGIQGNPRQAVASDLDGDGDLDVVLADPSSDTLSISRQLGPRLFATEPVILGGPGVTGTPESIGAADLDGDGRLDLFSANGTSDTLTLFLQNDDGTFGPEPITLGGPMSTDRPVRVCAGDFDGDGRLDLVCANANGENLTVFLQGADGFDPHPSVVLGGGDITPMPGALVAADFDGDRDLDLASANLSGQNVTLFFQTAPGVFDPIPQEIADEETADSPTDLIAADLEVDGDLDLILTSLLADRVNVLLHISPGEFDPTPDVVLGGKSTTPRLREIALADLDDDGDLDIVSANRVSDNLTVFFQDSPRVFLPAPLTLGDSAKTAGPFAVAAGDLDGDGDLDIVSANSAGDNLSIFIQTNPGQFDPEPIQLGDSSLTDAPRSVAVGDLDGDGDLDIVSANNMSDDLTVFFQTRPGQFGPAPQILGDQATTNSPESVVLADLDEDGDLDIVSANDASNNLAVFFQVAPGIFSAIPTILTSSDPRLFNAPQSVTVADLDGDGDLDIVSANQASNNLTVFHQRSPGNFETEPSVFLGGIQRTTFPLGVGAGDLDGDGGVDLVSANASGDDLSVFFQTTPGVFNPIPVVLGDARTDAPRSVVVADIDGDGDLDIASGNRESSLITLFFGGK